MKILTVLVIISIFFSFTNCGENYYKLLGVPRTATKAEIRKAFKKLSLKYHPDKNKKNPEKAKEMFIKIANAYEVLIDDKLRPIYDKFGEEGVKQHKEREGAANSGFHGGNFNDFFSFFFKNNQNQQKKINHFENTDILVLKMDNLAKLINRRKIWFVYFFKDSDYNFKERVDKLKEISSQSYGIFHFGAVNCEEDEEICEDNSVYGTPKIFYFPDSGSDGEEYKGSLDFQSILKFGSKRMQNFVRIINKDNYNDFISTHPERYYILLFTSKKSTSPLFKALSKDYLNHLNFGEIRQTEKELIQEFNIKTFPTLLVLLDPETKEVENFNSELKYDNIKKFLNKYGYKVRKENKSIFVRELDENNYEKLKMCSNSDNKNICLIIFIDKDKPIIEDYKRFETIGKKYIEDHVKVFYLNIIKYKDIFQSFEDNLNFENTSAVIVKGKRKKYIAISKEVFNNPKDFHNIMDNVLSGGGNFKKLQNGLLFKYKDNTKEEL